MPGSRGLAGAKGEPGEKGNDFADLLKSNWKQCVWKSADGKNSGLIQVSALLINCIIISTDEDPSLRIESFARKNKFTYVMFHRAKLVI